jgi:signal transduction histidine kinase
VEDISQDKERERRLKEAVRDLNRTTNSMDSFVRIVSHELRGPLNAASTWVSLMEVDASPEHISQGIAAIRHSIDDQARLIEDLVEGMRAASPALELETDWLDLTRILTYLVDEWKPRVSEKQQNLTHNLDSSLRQMRGDATRLRQIFGNLLSNASNYTQAGGAIRLSLEVSTNEYVVTVSDDGIGIRDDQLEQIFDPYWRGKSKVKGLGLGLAIVKALVEGHGGRITARSAGLGAGSEFEVFLPRDADQRTDSA